MAKFKRSLKKAVKSVKKVVDKVLKHASPNTKVGINATVQINTGATPVHQSTHNQIFKHNELHAQKKVESKPTEKGSSSNTFITSSYIKAPQLLKIAAEKKTSKTVVTNKTVVTKKANNIATTKKTDKTVATKKANNIATTKKMKEISSKAIIQKQDKKATASTSVTNTKNENKKTSVSTINQKSSIELKLPVSSKSTLSNNKNVFINNRFVVQQGIVSDKVSRQDYNEKEFARRISRANTILFNHKLSNSRDKYVLSPFSNKKVTTDNLRFELSQAILTANNDNNLFEQIKTATIAGMEISGSALSKHKSGVGLFLSTAAKKLGQISNVADLISVINYASKGDIANANKVIDNVTSGLVGTYLGGKIGAIGGSFTASIGAVAGGILLSDENNRKWIRETVGFRESNYKKGEFNYIDVQSLNRQSQNLKQNMASFSSSETGIVESKNLDSDVDILVTPSR